MGLKDFVDLTISSQISKYLLAVITNEFISGIILGEEQASVENILSV